MPNQIHNRTYLKDKRRALRKNLTKAEACLWALLKNRQTGRKFRRQHSIENYIVDFFCPAERLVVELDGEIHLNLGQANADLIRDKRLKDLNITVLRFENHLVINYPEWVITCIQKEFK